MIAPKPGELATEQELFFTTLPKAEHDLSIQVSVDPGLFTQLDSLTATESGILEMVTRDTGILGGEHAFGGYQILKKKDLEKILAEDITPLYEFTNTFTDQKPGFTQGVKPPDLTDPELKQ